MYFIPRNNRVYHYIAHTSVKNRYLCTGFFIISIAFIALYFFQRLITIYSVVYNQERIVLYEQYKNLKRIEKKNNDLVIIMRDTKKEIQSRAATENSQEYFKNQLLCVMDAIKSAGLKLNAYGIQKEKTFDWYIKKTAHFSVTGSLEQIMLFFETIKNAQKMISVVQWTVGRVDEKTFSVHADVEFIFITTV